MARCRDRWALTVVVADSLAAQRALDDVASTSAVAGSSGRHVQEEREGVKRGEGGLDEYGSTNKFAATKPSV